MNIQLKRFGKDIAATQPDGTQCILRACIYFNKGDEIPVSFIKTEHPVDGYTLRYSGIEYKCGKSQPTNSELYRTLITHFEVSTSNINLDAVSR